MTQVGVPTIYYGDEIGMKFIENAPAKEGSTLVGIIAPNAGGSDGERSGTRTPMQWDSSINAGFSKAAANQLYLPVDPDPERPTVESQENNPDSLLNFVRKLLKLRQDIPALGSEGEFAVLTDESCNYPLIYTRELDDKRYLIAINPSAKHVSTNVALPCQDFKELLQYDIKISTVDSTLHITLQPFGYGIVKLD